MVTCCARLIAVATDHWIDPIPDSMAKAPAPRSDESASLRKNDVYRILGRLQCR